MKMNEEKLKLSTEKPNLIAAFTSKTKGIGFQNDLPWKRALSTDLRWLNYLTTTADHTVALIMGRNTFESIGRPLPKRVNIVVSSKKIDGVINVSSIEEALSYTKEQGLIPVFFGGNKIFDEGLKMNCKVFFTIVDENQDIKCDTFFPEFDIKLTNITEEVFIKLQEKYKLNCLLENGKLKEGGFEFNFYCGENKIN